ncbi:MAG: site-2 protease family protein [Methanocellales archaeon]
MNKQVLPIELISKVSEVFRIYEITQSPEGDQIYIFGDPLVDQVTAYQRLWGSFSRYGYQIMLTHRLGENLIIVTKAVYPAEGSSLNILLAIATFFSTMFMGSTMFGVNPFQDPLNVFKGLPFTIAIMSVLGAHEFGHYIVSRKRGVQTSLPYFIPFPSVIGTLGAVIKQRSPIPDRKTLFDVGIAGPLLGIIASIIVTAIGLSLPPIALSQEDAQYIEIDTPFLFEAIASISNVKLSEQTIMHPVAFAGWVGMIVTVFNLLPAGQLDGGHIMRSIMGRKFKYLSMAVPFLLMVFGIYVLYGMNANGFIWIFWGFFTSLFASAEHPSPLDDTAKLDKKRLFLAAVILILGALCFTPAPFGSIP